MVNGYEGYIQFELSDTIPKGVLVEKIWECIDSSDGNVFYLKNNEIQFLYPSKFYKEKKENTGSKKSESNALSFRISKKETNKEEKTVAREPILSLFSWLEENGKIIKAEVTPYEKTLGERLEKILVYEGIYYRSFSLEKQLQTEKEKMTL